jgi:hypothetical protein
MLYLITLKISIIVGGVGSVWCSTLALLKSKEMLVSNAEACVNGSLVGTVFIFVGYCVVSFITGCMYPLDTQVSIINEI